MLQTRFLWLLTPIFAFLVSLNAFGYEVTKTSKKKGYVYIDAAKDSGIKKGQRVCINNADGKKITCGKVRKVRKKSSIVKVSKKKIKKIKKGFPVEVIGLEGGGDSTAAASGGTGKSIAIRALYLPGPSVITYNKMSYLPPAGAGIETLWDKGEAQSTAIASFGMELDLISLGLATGFKFKSFKSFETDEDYDANDRQNYLINSNVASSIGFYFDYYFMKTGSVGNGLRLGAGLDVDMSTITVKITNKNDTDANLNEEIYSLKSDLTVISLRLPVVYDMSFGGFGINAGLNLLIPVAGDAPTSETTITDANTANYAAEDKDAAAQEDIIAALGHLKSSFGAEVVMGMYFAF